MRKPYANHGQQQVTVQLDKKLGLVQGASIRAGKITT